MIATFVLVHGAFHGGWCWKKVRMLLQKTSHEVFTPTLTGLGERAHLLSPEVGLDTHIQDIVSVLEYEDLHQVILVGHSYGGMVITGVADRLPHRIGHLVYLDAFVPKDGQALCEQFRPEEWSALLHRASTLGDGWKWILQDPAAALAQWGVTDQSDHVWLCTRLCPQSIKTAKEVLRLSNPPQVWSIPRTFIYCMGNRSPEGTYHQSEARARIEPGWRYRQISSGHDAMITAPDTVATLLLEVADVLKHV